MKEKTYSKSIADAVAEFLSEDDWNFSFDENQGIFRFNLRINGKLKKINYVIDIRDDEYLVYAFSPLGADEDDTEMMKNMAEFICRANYGLKMGNFDLDFDDGEVSFKVHVMCEGITPTAEMIKSSIYCPGAMFQRYGDGICDIIFNNASAKAAVVKCEDPDEEQLCDLLSELLDDDDTSDPEDIAAHLAERLGITKENATDKTSGDKGCIKPKMDLFKKKGGTSE